MSIKGKFAMATLSTLLVSGTAMAGTHSATALGIKDLPNQGSVTISGTVDSIQNSQEFILRDSEGNTIDVDTSAKISLREGDRVQVNGVLDDELLGMGREIDSASVTVIDAANETTASAEASVGIGTMARDMAEDTKNMASTVGDNTKDAVKATGNKIKNTFAGMTDSDANTATDTEFKAQTIAQLPEKGVVNLRGTVESVDREDKSFILRDSEGKTIDVHTEEAIAFNEGDTVVVKGQIRSEMAGLGHEIGSARVTVAAK
ncbi:MAG: hypothetical protein ACPG80_00575 [Rickettsiales bacterium]